MKILQNNFIKISSIKKNNILEIFKNNDYINLVVNDNDIPISISLLNNNEDILSIDFVNGALIGGASLSYKDFKSILDFCN